MSTPDLSTREGREQLRKIVDEASEGPWYVPDEQWATIASGSDAVIMPYHPRTECHECGEPYDMQPEVVLSVEDEALICAARTAVPALLDALATAEDHLRQAMIELRGEAQRTEMFKDRADRAEAALQRVRDVLDTWMHRCQTEQTMRALDDVHRALDGHDGDPTTTCGRGPCALGNGHTGNCRM